LRDDYPRFQQLNAGILAISVEEPALGQRVADLLTLPFPVLSDPNHRVVDQYGVYNLLGDSLATPSVFIIDMEGVIRWAYVGESSADRPSNEMILEQLGGLATTA
jgi:peroxiredoxin